MPDDPWSYLSWCHLVVSKLWRNGEHSRGTQRQGVQCPSSISS
jgi:hypothetical protein